MYGECMCEGVHLCRALSRNFVMGGGGQKFSTENLWGQQSKLHTKYRTLQLKRPPVLIATINPD